VIGAPLTGWSSDRLGFRKPVILACVTMTFATFAALIHVPNQPMAVVYILLFVGGMVTGCSSVHYATIKEHNDPELTGTCVGFVNMITMSTSAVLQYLVGWLLDLSWDGAMVDGARAYTYAAYQASMLPLIIVGILAIFAAVAVRETHCRSVAASS